MYVTISENVVTSKYILVLEKKCDIHIFELNSKNRLIKTSYGWDPVNGIDLTTASESAGRQIQSTEIS